MLGIFYGGTLTTPIDQWDTELSERFVNLGNFTTPLPWSTHSMTVIGTFDWYNLPGGGYDMTRRKEIGGYSNFYLDLSRWAQEGEALNSLRGFEATLCTCQHIINQE